MFQFSSVCLFDWIWCQAVKSGLLKILSKMGISLLSSYCGAHIFEIYGLGSEVVDFAFSGIVSKVGGLNLNEDPIRWTPLADVVDGYSTLPHLKGLQNGGYCNKRNQADIRA
ncbi:hypothetical protein MKW94_000316 [Papaver nudicaule]|uniref:Glutamate synthase central-N domain-containing protein n=1 Tax=Papaver nudicaule TaxID=74823 RepID=A0AA41VCP0_PAPNU|nr:hypothetical protein [Papaver nudicaule]